MAKFVAELCKIAEYCEYREVLSDMLHDCVVCGISNKCVQCRLLQEPDLTFEKALEMAWQLRQQMETQGADKGSDPAGVQKERGARCLSLWGRGCFVLSHA